MRSGGSRRRATSPQYGALAAPPPAAPPAAGGGGGGSGGGGRQPAATRAAAAAAGYASPPPVPVLSADVARLSPSSAPIDFAPDLLWVAHRAMGAKVPAGASATSYYRALASRLLSPAWPEAEAVDAAPARGAWSRATALAAFGLSERE